MDQNDKTEVTVQVDISAPIDVVWKCWTMPEDIMQWNFASEEWCCPRAENDLQPGGKFSIRMEAKDGSMGFDLEGTYDEVLFHDLINYKLADGRKVKVIFAEEDDHTEVIEIFDAEKINPVEMQLVGWQSILNNFKSYVESIVLSI